MFDTDTFIGRFLATSLGIVVILAVVAPAAFGCTWLVAHGQPLGAFALMVVYVAAVVSAVTLFLDRN